MMRARFDYDQRPPSTANVATEQSFSALSFSWATVNAAVILWHVSFWLFIYLFFAYVDSGYDHHYSRAFINQAIFLPLKIGLAYCVLYYLMPHFLYRKRYSEFFLLLILSIIIGAAGYRLIQAYYVLDTFDPKLPFTPYDADRFLWAAFDVSLPAIVAVSVQLFKNRFESAQREQMLLNEKLQTELKFLKAQVSPHFLFNTLNNIYGLSLSNSAMAPEAILKLSDVLRFVLDHATSGQISIEEEVAVLEDYIALERLRYGERLDLKFVKDIQEPGLQIAPLILLSLVENAFKHGASESLNKPFIHIELKTVDDVVFFDIVNSKEADVNVAQEGIGLRNIRRQLELTYRNDYSLDIQHADIFYRLSLRINLHAHEPVELHDH
jgi:hypothetical protein